MLGVKLFVIKSLKKWGLFSLHLFFLKVFIITLNFAEDIKSNELLSWK